MRKTKPSMLPGQFMELGDWRMATNRDGDTIQIDKTRGTRVNRMKTKDNPNGGERHARRRSRDCGSGQYQGCKQHDFIHLHC